MYIKKYHKEKGFSIISALCILMLAVFFMAFGFKIYCNNLYHNNTNVIYDSLIAIEDRLEVVEQAEDELNSLSDLSEKMNKSFSINCYPRFAVDYNKEKDLFILFIYTGPEIKQRNLNYKMLVDLCDCNKTDCIYKIGGKKIILF